MAKEIKVTGIKAWSEDDRPREKLLKKAKKLRILLRTFGWLMNIRD